MRYAHTTSAGQLLPTYVYGGQAGYDGLVSDSISDVQNTGYRAKIKRGGVAMGDLSIVRINRSHADADFSYGPFGPTWGTERAWGDLAAWCEGRFASRASITNDLAHAKGRVVVDAYAKMNQSLVMGGEILATLDQTVSMLRHPFKSATDLLGRMAKYKKGRLGKTARSEMKARADTWLEYRYGWQPLLLDADNIVENASALSAFKGKRLVCRASIPFTRTMSWSEDVAGSLPRTNAVTGQCSNSSSGSASAGIIYEIKPRSLTEQLLATFGLRPCDVPATLWELVPYSFVVDWFSNVGKWIQAVTPVPGITILGSWVTLVEENVMDISLTTHTTLGPDGPYPAITWHGNGGSSSVKRTSINREINPEITFTPVLTGKSLSALHSVDAMALSTGRILSLLGNFKH
jgi:hypothetical protein